MDWNDYYDRVFDWAESTRVRRTRELTEVGQSQEIVEVLLTFEDDENAANLAKKAMALGVRFTASEVCECIGAVEWDTLSAMADTASTRFTKDELEEIYDNIDEDIYEKLEQCLPKSQRKIDDGEYDDFGRNVEILSSSVGHKPKKTSSASSSKKLLTSFKGLARAGKKIISGPPTTKQRLYSARAKARRRRPWWDK